jgi:hypothetical protein
MTADDDLRLIGMIRSLLTQLETDRAAFEAAITSRPPPKARRMSDEIRDALRTRTPMADVSSSENDLNESADVAVRSIQAVRMALENRPETLPLKKTLWRAKDGLKKWEGQVNRLKKKGAADRARAALRRGLLLPPDDQ